MSKRSGTVNQTQILSVSWIQRNQHSLSAEKVWGREPGKRFTEIQPLTLRSPGLKFFSQVHGPEHMLGFNEPIINRCALHHLWQRVVLTSIFGIYTTIPICTAPLPSLPRLTSLGQWNVGKVIPITFRVRNRRSSTWQFLQTLPLLRRCSRRESLDRPWTKSPWGVEPLPFLPPPLQSLCVSEE